MVIVQKFKELLSHTEQKRALLLLCMILIMALLDMMGVASIMPFMAVLANPDLIESNSVLSYIFVTMGFKKHQDFLIALGLTMFVLLVISLSFKALTTYAQTRFALMREYSIGKRLIEGYLHQPYSWFLNRHSADLGNAILSEVGTVVSGGLIPLLTLISQCTVAFFLMGLLLIVDPLLAVSVGSVLGAAYFFVFRVMTGGLRLLGEARVIANLQRFSAVSEAFGAAKEVKLAGLEQTYTRRFAEPAKIYAKDQTTAQIIAQLPRFFLEIIAFGGMLLVVLYLMIKNGSFAEALPVIALYAFAGYRLLPALQQIYVTLTQLRFMGPSLDKLHNDIKSLEKYDLQFLPVTPIKIEQEIVLNQVDYTYPNAQQQALKGITIRIPAKSTVGLVGSTGSGKTTTIDIILGLLDPQVGNLKIDDEIISKENKRRWQKCVGYVPQQIYLSDDTVASNIAFGLNEEDIDIQAVQRAAKIANLHDFVIKDLPFGYKTTIGERGVRLSGGQRQRIGIARALYNSPKVLILDEATSALDNLTEQAVMEAVHNLSHEITIILIAHRLSTVRECDEIFMLEKGKVISKGSYTELLDSCDLFRAMAGIH